MQNVPKHLGVCFQLSSRPLPMNSVKKKNSQGDTKTFCLLVTAVKSVEKQCKIQDKT